jgi:hypothetical protein
LIITFLGGLQSLFGQPVPWTVVPTSSSQEVVVKHLDSIFYDGSNLVIGDAIGIFYMQDETQTCAGYIQFDGVTNTFLIYGNDAVDNGFMNFEGYLLRYWRKAQNCEAPFTNGSLFKGNYFPNDSDTIYDFYAMPGRLKFSSDFFCKKNTAALPITLQTSNIGLGGILTSVSPLLPGYNLATKSIEDFTGANGNYTFTFSTPDNKCLFNTNFVLRISDTLRNNPSIEVTAPTCLNPSGVVQVDTSQLDTGQDPFLLKLKAEKTGFEYVSTNGTFHSLPSDNYVLAIVDQYSCSDTFTLTIPTIPIDCIGQRDIVTPNSNNEFSELFLPWEGETQIYNVQWQLVNTLKTPAIWEAKDSKGQTLQTGVYFVFTNGKKMKEITVVKEQSGN